MLSAKVTFTKYQTIFIIFGLIYIFYFAEAKNIFLVVNTLYAINYLFRLLLFYLGKNDSKLPNVARRPHHDKPLAKPVYNEEMRGAYGAESRSVCSIHEDSSTGVTQQLPLETELSKRFNDIYTIILPLYKEAHMLPSLISAISALDYPKNLLEVLVTLEEDDLQTIAAAKSMDLPKYCKIIIVPNSLPKTKPKACNYALGFATGKYVTIYDAEDKPEKDQLLKALAVFKQDESKQIICVQARLNFSNRRRGVFPRMFAWEYGVWFDFMLKGLAKLDLPVPLGGTSNHFITEKLRELGAWDSYNVTEDAELGLRIFMHRYRVALIDSYTWEMAPKTFATWLKQRSRWIKGYLQTTLCYSRGFSLDFKGYIGLILFIACPSIVYIMQPIVISSFFVKHQELTDNYFYLLNIALGYFFPLIMAFLVDKKFAWSFSGYIFLYPLYFFLHSIAGFFSLYELIVRPHYWQKTEHINI